MQSKASDKSTVFYNVPWDVNTEALTSDLNQNWKALSVI